MTQVRKERIRVYFEEHGQDFSWWDLEDTGDDYSYRVVDCGPFQAWHWTRYFVAKDSVRLGKRLLISNDGKTARYLKYPVTEIEISLARGSVA